MVIAGAVVLAALLAAHVVYWYVPRERAVVPRLTAGGGAAAAEVGGSAGEPLRVLAAGDYDVCVWVPYPHQNLGALAEAIGDLQDVVGAAARLSSGEAGEASAPRPREPEEAPTFGPFEVPPASEMVACSDLAGGRLRVVARIYPALAAVAKLAGRVAGNPWLAGGAAGSTRIAWQGRLWTVTAGPEVPRPPEGPRPPAVPPATAAAAPANREAVVGAAPELPESLAVVHWTGARPEIPAGYYALTRSGSDLALSLVAAAGGGGAADPAAALPGVAGPLPSLLVAVGPDWRGVEPFAAGPGGAAPLRDRSADSGAGSAAPSRGGQVASGAASRAPSRGGSVVSGSGSGVPSRGGATASGPGSGAAAGDGSAFSGPAGGTAAAGLGGAAVAARSPAALALFETGGSHLSTLGDLPGLAVFNAAAPGAAPGPVRWRLPTEGIFRLLAGRLPAGDLAGWRILALDPGSLRQAEALAPRLAALVPPIPAGVGVPAGASVQAGAVGAGQGTAAAGPAAAAGGAATVPTTTAPATAAAGAAALSLGLWLEPRSTLRIVTRIRRFVEKFPLATRRQVDLWRDWETVLDPLANCDHAVLAASVSPPSMRLLLRGCAASGPR